MLLALTKTYKFCNPNQNHLIMKKILFFFILGIVSCSTQKVEEIQTLTTQQADIPLLLSDIGNKLNILQIETEYPIGPTPEIALSEKYIYLFDQDYTQALYQIDYSGTVIRSIQFGMDEKLNINGINNLVVKNNKPGLVYMGTKIIWFDEYFNEEKTETMSGAANYHYPYHEGYVAFNNRINEDVGFDFFASSKSGLIDQALPINPDEYKFVYKSNAPFANWKKSLLFTRSFDNKIYIYETKNGLKPFAQVDFGNNAIPTDQLMKIKNTFDMMSFLNKNSFSYLSGEIYALNDKTIILGNTTKGKTSFGVWKYGEKKITTYPRIKDNFKSEMDLFHISSSAHGKTVFGINGEYVKSKASENFKKNYKEGFENSFFILVLE